MYTDGHSRGKEWIRAPFQGRVDRRWVDGDGSTVKEREVVATFRRSKEDKESWNEVDLRAEHNGTLTWETVAKDHVYEKNDAVASVSYCQHTIVFKGLCGDCGAKVSPQRVASEHPKRIKRDEACSVSIMASQKDLLVQTSLADTLERQRETEQLGRKKLSLVLDIDHTLLHTIALPLHSPLEAKIDQELKEKGLPFEAFTAVTGERMLVSLRPGLAAFLQEMHTYFSLSIYTNGTREYAEMIVRWLDPDGSLFHLRVMTRTEDEEFTNEKSLRHLFPMGTRTALVLDDSAHVWKHSGHVIRIEPYHFWSAALHNLNNAAGASMHGHVSQANSFVDPGAQQDDGLRWAATLLKDLHRRYFDQWIPDATPLDIKDIAKHRRSETLSSIVLCFSAVFTSNEVWEAHPLWKLAKEFGAQCQRSMDDTTTHLITTIHTSKVQQAKTQYPSVHVVGVNWLLASCCNWTCMPEESYLWKTPQSRPGLSEAKSLFISQLYDLYVILDIHPEEEDSSDSSSDGDSFLALML